MIIYVRVGTRTLKMLVFDDKKPLKINSIPHKGFWDAPKYDPMIKTDD